MTDKQVTKELREHLSECEQLESDNPVFGLINKIGKTIAEEYIPLPKDKNGVPYELNGYISTKGYEEKSKSKILSFSYLRDGWLVIDDEQNIYKPSNHIYIQPSRTLDEIKDDAKNYCVYGSMNERNLKTLIDEAYQLGRAEK